LPLFTITTPLSLTAIRESGLAPVTVMTLNTVPENAHPEVSKANTASTAILLSFFKVHPSFFQQY
jgi:hypothetical protein